MSPAILSGSKREIDIVKFIFIVQGEGRGHMTQSISLFKILIENGHQVCQVIVGKSGRRELPQFFLDQIDAPILQLESPNFVTDRNNKSVNIFKTVIFNLVKIRTYISNVNRIQKIVETEQPDTIINFYDFLGGLYFFLKKSNVRHIAIAHQFLLGHAECNFPKGRLLDKLSLRFGNKLAGFRAKKILGLSFQKFHDHPPPKIVVVPPLLRKEIKESQISQGDHFLVYMVNDGYSTEVNEFHQKNPEIPIHCFWDKKGMPQEYKKNNNLTFHQLDDKKFIELMSNCRGYLTTAGFESVCEAMYMGKPVLMVPVKGHYEQACNAEDAKQAGAGISSLTFDLGILLEYLPFHQNVQNTFNKWCNETEKILLKNLTTNAD